MTDTAPSPAPTTVTICVAAPSPIVNAPAPATPAPAAETAPPTVAQVKQTDQLGHDLTNLNCDRAEDIRDAFRRRGEVLAIMRQITVLKKKVLEAHRSGDKLYANLDPARWEAATTNFRRALTTILPYAICCCCGGEGCRACRGLGWLCKLIYEQAVKHKLDHWQQQQRSATSPAATTLIASSDRGE